jgi:hypothetical protein
VSVKQFADAFDLENPALAQKIKWCNDAVKMIDSVKSSIVSKCGDNEETSMILDDFSQLSYWLDLSARRLEIRK